MASTRDSGSKLRVEMENEMPMNQKNLVDNCFDEGQYDAGIIALDQLRSPNHRPSASHIRQLLYISLYPPIHNGQENSLFDPTASPSKIHKQQQKSMSVFRPTTIAAAQRLLMSFTLTNSPEGLFRTIPRYPPTESSNIPGNDDRDSDLALDSLCIIQSKNCWSLLRPGLIKPPKVFTTPRATSKRRRGTLRDEEEDNLSYEETTDRVIIVAEHAWPVLDWLLAIFERDEEWSQSEDQPRYSPLLLFQMPMPRGGKQARWELDDPLDVISFALQESEEKRKMMGYRLLLLLINISATVFLDYPLFITSLYTRMMSMSSEDLLLLFSSLPQTPVCLRFKVFFCQKYLNSLAIDGSAQVSSRPRPQARAVRPSRTRTVDSLESQPVSEEPRSSLAAKHSLPPCKEILRLMELDIASPLEYQLKFDMVMAYGILHSLPSINDGDPQWRTVISSEEMTKALDKAFGQNDKGEGRQYRDLLDCVVPTW